MNRAVLTCLLALSAIAGCAGPRAEINRSDVLALGDHYESPAGSLFVISVQDEYRLIRCIPDGPIAGCYDNLFTVRRDSVKYNRWLEVGGIDNLDIAFVSPTEVAFRIRPAAGAEQGSGDRR